MLQVLKIVISAWVREFLLELVFDNFSSWLVYSNNSVQSEAVMEIVVANDKEIIFGKLVCHGQRKLIWMLLISHFWNNLSFLHLNPPTASFSISLIYLYLNWDLSISLICSGGDEDTTICPA
jgi:hypothetical protein